MLQLLLLIVVLLVLAVTSAVAIAWAGYRWDTRGTVLGVTCAIITCAVLGTGALHLIFA